MRRIKMTSRPLASVARAVVVLALAGWLPSCSRSPLAVEQVDGMEVAVYSEPMPLAVGQGARFDVTVTGASDCRLSLQRMMPGMEMDTDQQRLPLQPQGGGRYQVEVGEFRMGGDWRLTIALDCPGKAQQTVVIDQNIPWPE